MSFPAILFVILFGINMWMKQIIQISKNIVVGNFITNIVMLCTYLCLFLIVRDNPCVVDGVDQWRWVRMLIGVTSKDTIKMGILILLY